MDPVIDRHGAWFNVRPVAMCTDASGNIVPCTVANNAEIGDSAIVYKVEFNPAYGFAITPVQQQIYIR
jgi:hypothetical protein